MGDVFCTNCGHRNGADSNFCSSCGTPLERPADDPVTITFQVDDPATEVVEDETALLRYVGEKGLRPGRAFRIVDRSPDAQALQLDVDGERWAAVSADLAALIWVRPR